MLLTEKYAPKSLSGVSGNKDAKFRIKQWALQYGLNKPTKPLLLYGPPGCGKTAIAHALATELEWNLLPLHPPGKNNFVRWEKQASELIAGTSLFSTSSLIVVEDIDQWHLTKIRGIIPKLTSLIKNCKKPFMLTAQDMYDRSISSLRSYCEPLQLKAINNSDILYTISIICKKEKLNLTSEQLKKIASNSKGDLRAAINDLQAYNSEAFREQAKKHFETVRACFRSPNYQSTFGTDLGPLMQRGTLKLFVSENMPAELSNPDDLARGYNRLSRSDIFDGRVRRRQYWGYLRYSSNLLVWGISSERKHVRAMFIPYGFPSYIRKMGTSKSRRAIYKEAAKKIAPVTHTTTRTARCFIPLIQLQASLLKPQEEYWETIRSFYRFDEGELAAILGVSPNSVKNNSKTKTSKKRKISKKSKN
ncbi:MAG: AAA family ATPase [Candidatus Micrarchaeota archaeon]